MRRFIYTIALLSALLFSACVINEQGSKRPDSLGTWIWHAVDEDLTRVNEILLFANHAYNYITLDAEAREEYHQQHLYQYVVSQTGSTYYFVMPVTSSTSITHTVTLYDDRMELSRSGGSSYKLVLKRSGSDRFKAEFESLNYLESEGSALFDGYLRFSDEQITLAYKGTMTMVDSEESATKPLTLKTRISETLVRDVEGGVYNEGLIYIDCYDERYGSHDEVLVRINPSAIYVTTYGVTEAISQD